MAKQLLAVDIGAGSGRIIRGCFENNRLSLREEARFSNPLLTDADGYTYWDFEHLSKNVLEYLKSAAEADSIGFDSFSPDFGIFDSEGRLCHHMLSYHNYFQESLPARVLESYSEEALHDMCGNPPSPLGILARLCWLQDRYEYAANPGNTLLPLANALAFSLCGERFTDFSYSFDCGIGNLEGKWNENLTRFLKAGSDILPKVLPFGETVGYFKQTSGKKLAVINTALHDTASAYYALRLLSDGQLCMNAGTWFSVGVPAQRPILTPQSKQLGVENIALPDESFIHGHTFPGAWFLQTFRKEIGGIPFGIMSMEARNEKGAFISADVSDMSRYQGSAGLITTIRKDMENCGITNPGDYQVLRSIYEGLANAVAQAITQIETISHKKFTKIFMSGGVTQDSFLCSLIEEKTQTKIVPCMKEASVVGNLIQQLQGQKLVGSLEECQMLMKNLEE